ncbi:MAG: GyrI-like domain-containing protein [Maribacter sp.]
MQTQKIKPFQIIGISIRTSNENSQAASDIGSLWAKFMTENVLQKVPNKISDDIFSIYTNYESDHTKPYDTILGCKVSSLDVIPEGMVGQSFEGGTFAKFISKGDLAKGVVYNTWTEIWNTDLDRLYTADFEVYGKNAQNPSDAEVDIFVAIKE